MTTEKIKQYILDNKMQIGKRHTYLFSLAISEDLILLVSGTSKAWLWYGDDQIELSKLWNTTIAKKSSTIWQPILDVHLQHKCTLCSTSL